MGRENLDGRRTRHPRRRHRQFRGGRMDRTLFGRRRTVRQGRCSRRFLSKRGDPRAGLLIISLGRTRSHRRVLQSRCRDDGRCDERVLTHPRSRVLGPRRDCPPKWDPAAVPHPARRTSAFRTTCVARWLGISESVAALDSPAKESKDLAEDPDDGRRTIGRRHTIPRDPRQEAGRSSPSRLRRVPIRDNERQRRKLPCVSQGVNKKAGLIRARPVGLYKVSSLFHLGQWAMQDLNLRPPACRTCPIATAPT